ncbi:glycoside hydrolase family 13 protein [Paramicrobacterium chengjingii]|uniref:Glycoside hydrolase family 13 protein n=1 Tax=Paramicrobacterium chengjingii TaxID=2769067 RepID=A0ABX6YJR4_9MICO|nr:glycoside hydrolase family 13 protein [Microbacterium chengjingii]QPZ39028.1 glycoside hydrolase family 13 protein [Microbacterium chengjingii]
MNTALEPHHDGSPLYVSTQHPHLGEAVVMRLRVPRALGKLQGVRVRSNPDREPVFAVAQLAASASGWDWWQAEVTVANRVHGYRWLLRLDDGTDMWVNARGVFTVETLDSDDFRLVAADGPPEWVASTVMYQVFPDRFWRSDAGESRPAPEWAVPAAWSDELRLDPPARSTQFYGGDLDGIVERLDHLERLGVTMIYLTPVFPARSNHRYDATSFDMVDPLLGGDEALIRLVEAAHARGLKVIGDLTSNHSGDAHEWFTAARGNPAAPESDFYYWRDAEHEQYESWLGVPSLPKFNWNSRELRRRFIEGDDSVVATWLKAPYSLDGWRIDVANMTGRHGDDDLNAEVRQTIRRTMVDINPDTILLAESTNDASSDFQGDAWHGAMTYANFTRPLWGWLSEPLGDAGGGLGMAMQTIPRYDGWQFYAAHRQFSAGFPWRVRLGNMNALDTHDTPRFLTRALPGTLPVAVGMSVTLPGIPVVWAGDEFGLTGEDGEASRTPIPWHAADAASDTIDLYAELIALKREHSALNGGGIRWVHVSADVLAYVREDALQSLLVVSARANVEVDLPIEAIPTPDAAEQLFGSLDLAASADSIRISGSGPAFAVWRTAGVTAE